MAETAASPGEVIAFRHFVYRVFSTCLLQVPSPAMLALFTNPEWGARARTLLGGALPDLCADLSKDQDSRALTAEYAALFVIPGPKQTCPYETYYREKYRKNRGYSPIQRLGYVSLQVQRAYAQWGVRADLNTDELPDHAGVEMRFMSLLVAAERCSRKSANDACTAAVVRAQLDFLNEHILQWFPEWLDCVLHRAGDRFYWYWALVLKRFLETEKTTLRIGACLAAS